MEDAYDEYEAMFEPLDNEALAIEEIIEEA